MVYGVLRHGSPRCRTLGCIPVAHPDSLDKSKLGEAKMIEDIGVAGSKLVKVRPLAGPCMP